MRYYVMELYGTTQLPRAAKEVEVVMTSELSRYREIDYDPRSGLISDRLKQLMGLYLPQYEFSPVVYMDREKNEQLIYWRFSPEEYECESVAFRKDGIIERLHYDEYPPLAFTARSPRGVRSIAVRMAIVESALRRGILGVKFVKVS